MTGAGLQISISNRTDDDAWNDFLARTLGGHHVQTSHWAQVKALLGYRVLRLTMAQPAGELVGGAQILTRQVAPLGRVGFISKGPVLAESSPELIDRTVHALMQAARQARLVCLIAQPAGGGEAITQCMTHHGFQPVDIELAPRATVILDLSLEPETLMAQMKPKTRYNIRLGQRKGVTVRQGDETDLGTFYRLVQDTGRRQRFNTYSLAYFEKMWQLFRPKGLIHLFVTECEGEAVSAGLLVTFRDTVIYKMGGWSGRFGQYRPNEVMHWNMAQWAREQGYRYYDFEGVESNEGREADAPAGRTERNVSSFKLGFGGQVINFPGSYLYFPSPMIRTVYRWGSAHAGRLQLFPKIAMFLRTR